MREEFTYQRVGNSAELEALGDAWQALHARQEQQLLPMSHVWHLAWWDNFGAELDLDLGCVFQHNNLIAIAPLYSSDVRKHGFSLRTTMLTSNGYSPFCDLLLAPTLSTEEIDEVLQLLLLNNPGEVLSLAKLPAEGIVAERAQEQSALPANVGIQPNLRTPVIRMQEDWEDFLKSRSRSSRKSIRRKLKRLQGNDSLEAQEIILEDSSNPVLNDMVAVSARSWKAEVDSDLKSDVQGRHFLWRLIDELGPGGGATAWLLLDDNQLIAYELHLSYEGTVYPIRADYDEAFAHYSPGSILMAHALQQLFLRGAHHTYDCCGNDYDYLRSWTDDLLTYIDLEFFSFSARASMAYAMKYKIAPLARSATKMLGKPSDVITDRPSLKSN